MALIPCCECKGEISDKADKCIWCGAPTPIYMNWQDELLKVGIVFMPCIFAWFTLHKRFTARDRAAAFIWMVIFILNIIMCFAYS